MKSIKCLPKSVHSSLRSSIVLSNLPRVVEELIYNSIDANASKIDITVDVKACYVKVEDDGCGITRDELVLLGEKYATSKFHDVLGDAVPSSRSFGLNGEALASLCDVSVVEVRTKARGRPNSYCKIIKGSKCLHLGIDDQREVVGTTVIVRELFYNQPVRRKYMQSSHKRELHCVKKCVLRVALIHPQVLFRLLDIDSEEELLYTVPSSSPLTLVSDSFGNDVSSCLREIVTSDQDWVLSGHISGPTDAFSTKAFQYLYINSRFVNRSPIHNMLNTLAASFQYSMVKRGEEIDLQSKKRQKIAGYPAYLLNLCCPRSSYDLHFEPSQTVVEFKDWHTILFFFEQTITNFWKQHVLQKPREKAPDDRTCTALKSHGKLGVGPLKCQCVQKGDHADLYQSSPQQNAVRDGNVGREAAKAQKNLCSFPIDLEPCTWNIGYSDQISDVAPGIDIVARNDLKLGNKKMYSPKGDSYGWLDGGPFRLEDHDLSDVDSTVWKKRRTQGIFCGNGHFGNFGMSEDARVDGLLADALEPEIIAPEMELQEYFFGDLNRMSCGLLQNQTNTKVYGSAYGGFGVELDKLNEDCLLGEVRKEIANISCPYMSHCSDGLYHKDGAISRGFCSVIKKCSTKKKLRTSAGYVEPYTAAKSSFPRMREMWESDCMDGPPAKDTCLDFCDRYPFPDIPCGHTSNYLELHSRLDKGFDYWNCENMDHDLGITLDRFNEASPIICRGTKRLRNLDSETQMLSNFNYDNCSLEKFVTKDDQMPWKSKLDARLSYDCSPEKSITDCYLNLSPSRMSNRSNFIEDVSNQQYFECRQTSPLCKGRPRSLSAPPFYRGKQKFSRLSDCLTKLTGKADKDLSVKGSAGTACSRKDISHMNATQPIPETAGSCEFSDLNFSLKGNVKMHEETCCDGLEESTAKIKKWRSDSNQETMENGLELPNGPFGCCEDVLSISSGPLHLSCSSLVPDCIDKNCFEEARVLLQLDKKFIPVISGETLLLVDQHAADERIRLEELRSKVLSDEGREITYLDSEEDLALPEMGFQLFQKYADQIHKWGWISKNGSKSSQPFKKNMNILRRQARLVTLFAVPCILGINLTGKDLVEFIEQLDETDGSSTIPPAVLRVLNFKACRGAIMFGDSLLHSECSLIIEELKTTSLCFQCAHGRPTTVPVVNVASLHEELARLEMLRGGRAETWHGLSHHVPNLERAQTRLTQLKRLRCME